MKFRIFYLMILLGVTVNSCKVYKSTNEISCSDIELIKNFIQFKFKSDSKYGNIHGSILKKVSYSDELEDYLNEDLFQFISVSKKKGYENLDLESLFNEKEFAHMKCQFEKNNFSNWQSFTTDKKLLKYVGKLKDSHREYGYSIPLFSRDKKFCLIYRESLGAGSFQLFIQSNEKWDLAATILVWIT